ncbi:SPL family radical SAM protein [Paenibacillus abyssi]|uniref:Radical SAM protein n=1 Tax=Paenibacillus abyssi TaxID=1340531 RepID=A0A917G4F9_9BACL|nr:radical SAM protein [Paenibacillus abyssi]GGG22636.1 radical SAM protein [Paenibacillus abyssi]
MPKQSYSSISTKQTLNRVSEEKMPFDWSINPYRGCAHGCSFCYARAFQRFIGLESNDEFQHHIILKTNAAEALEAQLARNAGKFNNDISAAAQQIGLVNIGTATDPYQPVEGKALITRECLKVLAKYRIATTITTRSPLILRDLDVLKEMNIQSVNISINTTNTRIIRKMEPAAPLPAKRLETVSVLTNSGIRTGIFVAPVLPYLTDSPEDLESLIASAKAHHAQFAMISALRLSKDVKAWYLGVLNMHFPQLLHAYKKLYTGAYAPNDYAASLRERADHLLQKYGLSRDTATTSNADHRETTSPQITYAPPCSNSVYQPDLEQLSFSFEN